MLEWIDNLSAWDWGLAAILFFGAVLIVWALWDIAHGRYWWHPFYNGVLGWPLPGESTEVTIVITAEASASPADSTPLPKSSDAVKPRTPVTLRRARRIRPMRFKRLT